MGERGAAGHSSLEQFPHGNCFFVYPMFLQPVGTDSVPLRIDYYRHRYCHVWRPEAGALELALSIPRGQVVEWMKLLTQVEKGVQMLGDSGYMCYQR